MQLYQFSILSSDQSPFVNMTLTVHQIGSQNLFHQTLCFITFPARTSPYFNYGILSALNFTFCNSATSLFDINLLFSIAKEKQNPYTTGINIQLGNFQNEDSSIVLCLFWINIFCL